VRGFSLSSDIAAGDQAPATLRLSRYSGIEQNATQQQPPDQTRIPLMPQLSMICMIFIQTSYYFMGEYAFLVEFLAIT